MENAANLDRHKMTEQEKHLIAPCGIYCGACDIFLGRSRDLAKELHRITSGFNFADVGPFFMGMEQERILDFLNILDTWGRGDRCPGCLAGGGNPVCDVKGCAQHQGFLTCSECDKMPCNLREEDDQGQPLAAAGWLGLVTRRYAHWNIDNLERIREIGYRQFIDEMQPKVEAGFLTSDVISSEMVITEAFQGTQGEE
jgi:hypothetical protein